MRLAQDLHAMRRDQTPKFGQFAPGTRDARILPAEAGIGQCKEVLMLSRPRRFARPHASLLAVLGFALSAQGCCDARIVTGFIPDGCVGEYYIYALQGACADNHWVVTHGDLPPGIQLSNPGVLSGTPTLEGMYLFTVTLSPDFNPASKGFSMAIHEAGAPECTAEEDSPFEPQDGGVDAWSEGGEEWDDEAEPL
jgi:hypothetical protein